MRMMIQSEKCMALSQMFNKLKMEIKMYGLIQLTHN
jgi:hypothetical protein